MNLVLAALDGPADCCRYVLLTVAGARGIGIVFNDTQSNSQAAGGTAAAARRSPLVRESDP
jgi:hypothetical protein